MTVVLLGERRNELASVSLVSGAWTFARTASPGCDQHSVQAVYPGCSESGRSWVLAVKWVVHVVVFSHRYPMQAQLGDATT